MANMTVVTVVGSIPADASAEVGGQIIWEPSLGFQGAYAVGDPVWDNQRVGTDRAILTFVTGAASSEAFGSDANGNLISLGTPPTGWVVTFGNSGGIEL